MRKILMLGIGGMGMTPLAVYLSEAGNEILGHDDNLQEPNRRILLSKGIQFVRRPEDHLDVDIVVYSNALSPDLPIIMEAKGRGIRTLRRGEMLAEESADKKLVAIVGSHGKTTTAGLLSYLLEEAQFPCSYLVGGLYRTEDCMPARYSEDSPWIIAEVDESDGTIDRFNPEITIVLNSDWDHADFYKDKRALTEGFLSLLARTKGTVLLNNEDELNQLCDNKDRITFGTSGDFTFSVKSESFSEMELELGGRFETTDVAANLSGNFNAYNATAALAVTQLLTESSSLPSLEKFPGIYRRQEKLFADENNAVFMDYAHHPREIDALLGSFREAYPSHRIVSVFQPHRISRTEQFAEELSESLAASDELLLMSVYSAGEQGNSDAGESKMMEAFKAKGAKATFANNDEVLLSTLKGHLSAEPTIFLFIGAGDIEKRAFVFASMLKCPESKEAQWLDYIEGRVSEDCKLEHDYVLATKTTIRIGGPARFYAEPADVSDLRVLVESAKFFNLPLFVLGRGSNLLILEKGFKGVVIRLNHESWREVRRLDEDRIWIGAGVRLKEVCGQACKLGMSGFEFLEGIPGSLGGSLRMNAGAMGNWMFDVVDEVRFMTMEGTCLQLKKEDFHVGYRRCDELKTAIAVGAILRSSGREDSDQIQQRIKDYSVTRKSSQPREPSAGCIFKNPEGGHAGQIIDELGLKGRSIGGAAISETHGNFIVNKGGATSDDVISLIKMVRKEALESRGIDLEPEVLLLGDSWNEIL